MNLNIGAIAVLTLLTGLVLFILAMKGRQVDDHPICRACGFDLIGAHEPRTRCPECGRDVAARRAVRIGNRTRRPRIAVVGALLTLLGLAGTTVIAWGIAAQTNWNTFKPEWWLVADFTSGDPQASDPAAAELARRLERGRVSDRRRAAVIDTALKHLVDDAAHWAVPWGELLAVAWKQELLSPEQRVAFVRALPRFALNSRRQTAQGLVWRPRLVVTSPRSPDSLQLRARMSPVHVELNGVPLEPTAGGTIMFGLSGGGRASAMPLSVRFSGEHEPGTHTLTARWRISIQEASLRDELPGTAPIIAEWEFERSVSVSVLPEGQPVVQIIDVQELTEQMGRCIQITQSSITPGHRPGEYAANCMVQINGPPMNVTFQVYWRVPDEASPGGHRELLLGTAAGRAASGYGTGLHQTVPADFRPTKVDVILRSSATAAAETDDFEEIWGGEVIIRDVAVELPDGDAPDPSP